MVTMKMTIMMVMMISIVTIRILWTGYKRPLEEDDLWALNSKSRSSNVVPRLRSIWDYQKMKCKRSDSFIF